MLKIEIKDPQVETREIKGAKGSFKLHSVTVWVHIDDEGYPEKAVLPCEEGFTAEPGVYRIHPKSFKIGQYNRLEFDSLKLAKA
jgi:hypothetical protein